jgi:cold shock CspA family protein
MAKSQQSFNKSEKEKKRLKKRQDKLTKKEVRKANSDGGDFENMIAYVDENGMITDTPPDPSKKKKISASSIEIGVPKKDDKEIPLEQQGKVSYFDDSKGFGFIIDSQTQEKYFVHVSGLLEDIKENDKVSYELQRGLKGMNAVKVKKI